MNPKLMIAGALAFLAPFTASPAFAQQEWSGGGYGFTQPARGFTELRIAPPAGGQVYVYEGHRLLGRFDRAGSMLVANGRDYRVVAMRGDTQVWAGNVTAGGAPVELRWDAVQRFREPISPPPALGYPPPPVGYGASPRPYEAPPRFEQAPPRFEQAPPRFEQAPPMYAPGGLAAPVISSADLRSLLRELDTSPDDQDRLDAVAEAASRFTFAVPQVDWILGRFRSDAYRLAALEKLHGRMIDRDDGRILLQRFRHPAARHQAEDMIGW